MHLTCIRAGERARQEAEPRVSSEAGGGAKKEAEFSRMIALAVQGRTNAAGAGRAGAAQRVFAPLTRRM